KRQPGKSPPPQPINAVVRSNRKQPGGETPLTIKARQARVGPQKDLLAGVFGILSAPKHPVGQVVDRAGVPVHQLTERCAIAAERLVDPADLLDLLIHAVFLRYVRTTMVESFRESVTFEKSLFYWGAASPHPYPTTG